MSDVMLFGVLKMPYEMAMADELSRRQFYDRVQEAVARLEGQGAWQAIETAPYATPVLAWLHLPKNPLASGHVIAERCYVQEDEPESYGKYRRTVGCWWANGMYYTAGHVTRWMPLPVVLEGERNENR